MAAARKPLRLLFLNYEFPPIGGGAGTASRQLALGLCRGGHRVEVVTAWFRGLPRVWRRGRLVVRRLRVLRARAGQCRPHEMASYMMVAFVNLLLRGGRRPDAIVSFHSIPSGVPGWLLSVLWGVPHIVLFRGGDVPGFLPQDLEGLHRRTMWLNRMIVRQAAAALANSDGLRELAIRAFPFCEVGVLRNGVETRWFRPAPRPQQQPFTMLFAGRLTNQKGLDTLVAAAHRMRALAPQLDWRLLIAGEGPIRGGMEADLARRGLGERVEFLGWVSRADMPGVFQRADAFVFPSRYEGMPNAVLEAMASGLPVVGTRIAGTEELVREGANGMLIEPDDAEALARALIVLANDGDLRARLGGEARRDTVRLWSWQARAAELGEVARAVAGGRR